MDLVSVIKIMMREDKILLCIDKLEDIDRYKELGISHFLVPLENYTIGYDSFSFEEISKIDANVYILANRVLTDEDIDEFLNLKIPKNVKGFVLEDIGLYYELKDKGYKLINFQNHLNNNYETINFWLKHFDSLVISTDITKEEIIEIVDKSTKPLILNTFGYPLIMYSRRNLVSNFNRHFNNEPNSQLTIEENIFKSNFILKENYFGTAVFNSKISDYRVLMESLPEEKIEFYLVFANDLSFNTVRSVILGEMIPDVTDGFLNKKTIYKVGDIK